MRFLYKKGYSLIELTVSLLVFLVAASVISLAVAQSLSASAQSKTERAALSSLESLTNTLASAPFLALATDTFIPPSRCESDIDLVGSAAQSCVIIEGREYKVTWSVDNADAVDNTASVLSYLNLTGKITLLNQDNISHTTSVKAPSDAWKEGFGAVRVSFIGPYNELEGPVYLISGSLGSFTVIDSVSVSEGGVAVLTAPSSACTSLSPCRVSIASDGVIGRSGEIGMRAGALSGSESSIVLGDGVWVGLSVRLFEIGGASIEVVAVNEGGIAYRNTIEGSLCIWGTFVDDLGERSVPFCNNDDGIISIDRFSPDPAYPGALVPVPTGVTISLSLDHPSGKCVEASGMKGSTATGWVSAAVCSSWSWGLPSSFTKNGVVGVFEGSKIILEPGVITSHTLTFSGALSRPASGYGADAEGWSRPRQAAGCAFDGSCSSLQNFIPESTECPGSHCLSAINSAPRVTAPLNGSLGIHTVVISGESSSFTPSFQDADGDEFMATIVSLPGKGALNVNGVGAAIGGLIPSNGVNFTYIPNLTYDGNDSFVIRLNDGKSNGSRDVEIGLVDSFARPWMLLPKIEPIKQVSNGVAEVTVYNAGGNLAVSAPVTYFSSTPGVIVNSLVATGLDGVAKSGISVGAIARGSYSILIESGGRSMNSNFNVLPNPGSVTATVSGVSQGGRGVADIDVYDKVGTSIIEQSVSLAVLRNNSVSYNVYPEYAGCILSANGCSVDIVADANAVEGQYILRSSIGGLIVNTTFTVAPSTAKILVPGNSSISQGEISSIMLKAVDPSGASVDGASISVLVPARFEDRVSVSNASGVTNSNGEFTFNVTAPSSATAGDLTLLASVGGKSWPVKISVKSVAQSLIYTAPNLSISQGGVGTTWVSVIDKAGDVMKGAVVTFTPSANSGLRINSSATTGVDGRATFSVSANGNAKAGLKSVTASLDSYTVSFSVLVLSTPNSLNVVGEAIGANGNFKVFILDGAGDVMKGAPAIIEPVTGGAISLRSGTSSGIDGSLTVDVENAVVGEYRFKLSSSGKSLFGWYDVK